MVEVYAGLDVSDKSTHVCVVDGSGAVLWSGACATDPEVITRTLKARAPGLARAVLETGKRGHTLFPLPTRSLISCQDDRRTVQVTQGSPLRGDRRAAARCAGSVDCPGPSGRLACVRSRGQSLLPAGQGNPQTFRSSPRRRG